jgi:hypothetical protein
MKPAQISTTIAEGWKKEAFLSSPDAALPETFKLKVNQKAILESIRSVIASETLVMHEPCVDDFFVNGEPSGEVKNTKILEDWLLHIDCLLEKAESEKSKTLASCTFDHSRSRY